MKTASLKITAIDIYKYAIPMKPFTIATGTMHFAQNIFIRVHTNAGWYGVGECSAFPMIVGETQATCYEMAKEFAKLWIGKEALQIDERIQELHLFTAGNYTAKSAFDMALYDIASKHSNKPLYKYLGGSKKTIISDLTIGIDTPSAMAITAKEFVTKGVKTLKVKLGKNPLDDINRIEAIRASIGNKAAIRIDANQGWTYKQAIEALNGLGKYNIEFCEQPMRTYNNHLLPSLMKKVPIKIMADESVYTHHDAEAIIRNKATHYINIKFAKSGGIHEALKIVAIAEKNNIPCMMGGMLESRIALTAKVHFAMAKKIIQFYDLDTCLLGHTVDPVIDGVTYKGMQLMLTNANGIGADVQNEFLSTVKKVRIK
jgi:L-Ala-D/L-Glu epimerase